MLTDLPPVGPDRDRLVAEALGCTTWSRYGCTCKGLTGEGPWPHDAAEESSTSNHAALDALEAWKRGGPCRTVSIILDSNPDSAYVRLEWPADQGWDASAPTLGDAASRAIIEAKRSEG